MVRHVITALIQRPLGELYVAFRRCGNAQNPPALLALSLREWGTGCRSARQKDEKEMSNDARTVKEVVRKINGGGRADVAVVLCSNGKLGILRNGELMPAKEWTVDRMAECVEFAERMAQT
jgi:hypothetical protein